jgi:hypothetical protein
VLDDALERLEGGATNIIVTQPRRIAAISLAERVSAERCEPGGPGKRNSQVRARKLRAHSPPSRSAKEVPSSEPQCAHVGSSLARPHTLAIYGSAGERQRSHFTTHASAHAPSVGV